MVKAGELTKVSFPIVTGQLVLVPPALAGGGDVPKDLVSYSIERLEGPGGMPAITRSGASDLRLALEAGRYRVTQRIGLVNVSATAETAIRAGLETRLELKPTVALMTLQFGDDGALAPDVLWEVRDTNGKPVWSTTGTPVLVPLAPGAYDVRAYRAGREKSTSVTLGAGEQRAVVIRPE